MGFPSCLRPFVSIKSENSQSTVLKKLVITAHKTRIYLRSFMYNHVNIGKISCQ